MVAILNSALDRALAERERKRMAESYFNDPAAWAKYMLDVDLWSKQREVGHSVVENKSTAVKAGHGVGKSFLVAVLVCWWIDTRYPNVYVATTAPSTAQINAIVWREVRRMKNDIEKRFEAELIDHKLPGYITADAQWKDDGGNLIGFGRKPPDNKEDSAFQGLHDGYVLAIGDEACGLTEEIIDALGNITSNANSRRVLIANPTNPASYFAKIFKANLENWTKHTISVLQSPNFTDERFLMSPDALSKLSDQSYVDEKREEYGVDSARYKARVLGEFAFDSENSLISPDVLEYAKATDLDETKTAVRPVLGVDVARYGSDRSVVYKSENGKIRRVGAWAKESTTETARRVHKYAMDEGASMVYVDSDGVGGGVKDQLVELAGDYYLVVEVHGSAASPDRRQWHNFRAFMWDMFRLRCAKGMIDLDATDEDLHDELLSVQYKFNVQSGGLLIESKDDMKARGMRSPDLADAAIYSSLLYDLNDPLLGFAGGDKMYSSAEDIIGEIPQYMNVMRGF